ncbi:ABC transporter permease [Paenibacillus swuensis]|uniref:ABC transporter permease n=1 Tax=Paenibacillus swuensis TaxID=1178515 RepID=A0A172THA1_9BACL|nr:ABC transporter permease [Paenibacillus swuensis]ANE46336.1 ABC transporter permease [Paenibacillus swuensis]
MRSYLQLTLAQLRIFGRNRQVLFWSLFFPIFFMLMLGSFMGNGGGISITASVVNEDGTPQAAEFITALNQVPGINTKNKTGDREQELKALKDGDLQMLVVIPQGYGKALQEANKSNPVIINVFYDETEMTTSQVGVTMVGNVVDAVSKKATGYEEVASIQSQGVQSINLKYIDFLVPGIVAMMIMNNNLNGVAGQISSWRERGILRRMQSTPLQSSSFIAAQISARLLMNGMQAVIVLVIGSLVFGTQVNGSWLLLLSFVVLGTLAFMSIGFIIAGLAKTPESAGPIAGFISFPLIFLGGVFFPIKDMPEWLQGIVNLLPIAHLSTAMRQIMNVGAGFTEVWGELALLGGWTLAAFIVASLTFKWE